MTDGTLPKTRIGVFCLLLCLGIVAYAQTSGDPHAQFNHITQAEWQLDGLVTAIAQDDQGYMWFATDDGLVRYDGYDARTYRHDPDQAGSLPDNVVLDVFVDRSGTLWVGTLAGLSRFDMESDEFVPFGPSRGEDGPGSVLRFVHAVTDDRDGSLWVGTDEQGLFRFNPRNDSWTRFEYDPDDPNTINSNRVLAIHEDSTGVLWAGTNKGLNRFDTDTRRWTPYDTIPPDFPTPNDHQVYAIIEDADGTLWYSVYGTGLVRFDPKTEEATHFTHDAEDPSSLSVNKVHPVLLDSDGGLWAGTWDGGLNLYDQETGDFVRYGNDPLDPASIGPGFIRSIFEDRAGSLWLGIDGWGVSVLHRARSSFKHYTKHPFDPNSLSDPQVRAIHQDQSGAIWIGTRAGLNRLEPETGNVLRYFHDPEDPTTLGSNSIYAIHEDQSGALWIGTFTGLNRFDPDTGSFTRFLHDPEAPSSLSHSFVLDISEDTEGNLWLLVRDGLNRFDRATERFEHYPADPNNTNGLTSDAVSRVHVGRENIVWIATFDEGLVRFDPTDDTWRYYQHEPEDPRSLSSDTVIGLHEDSTDYLWVGTAAGLNRLDPESGHVTRYGETDGLPAGTIAGILEDDQGYLWMATNQGLSRFDPASKAFKHFNTSDGLANTRFDRLAHHQTRSGELWYGGAKGIDIVDPARIVENSYVPPVVITAFEINNQPVPVGAESVLSQPIDRTEAIRITHQDRVISFEFAALNFVSPERNSYAYMLEGFDQDWIETSSDRRRATYTNLDPGSYTFRVRGSNNDGVWNEEGVSLTVTVAPAWWETWWFLALCAFTVVSVAGLVYREKANQLRRERAVAIALREREEKYRVLFESFPLGITVTDGDGRIVETNAVAEQLLGLPKDQHQHRTISGEEWTLIGADQKPIPVAEYPGVRALTENQKVGSAEIGVVKPDGKTIWLDVTAAPIPLKDYGVAISYNDVSDRKEAEFRIQFQANLLSHVGQAVIATDPSGTIIYWNPFAEVLYGWTADEALGKNVVDITPSEMSSDQARGIMESLRRGVDWCGEFLVKRKDGSTFPADVTDSPITDAEGNLVAIIGISSDMTVRKEAEDKLKASLSEKQVLLRELNHRTKNTLQLIRSVLSLQASRMSENEQVQELVHDMENRTMAISLVHQKLYQSQDLSRLDLGDYLRELSQLILQSFNAPSRNVTLTFALEQAFVLLDTAIPCGLIVNELLSNSIKHGYPDGGPGTIEIQLHRNSDARLVVRVADNGIGVSSDFDVRQQESLGLQTVLRIAEDQMNGEIRCAGNDGMEWEITFPDTLYDERV